MYLFFCKADVIINIIYNTDKQDLLIYYDISIVMDLLRDHL